MSFPRLQAPMYSADPEEIRVALNGARTVLGRAGFSEQFTAITSRRTRALRRRPSIVVVGEVSTGKSTLVNALLERPGLSPTGHGETTGTYARFTAPTTELPEGSARVQFLTGNWTRIDQSELAQWILVGSPELVAEDGRMSLGVVVAAESPVLPGVDIIDTPGTGGLSPAHARVAISTAEQASVLLLVTDASGRIARPALDLLAQCTAHVDTIAVAVSRIDLVGEAWEQVAEENRRILLAEDPAYADVPIVGVSALAALQALDRPDDVRRARRRAASRIDDLIVVLRGCLERSRDAPDLRALTDADRLLQVAEADLDAQGRALRVDTAHVDEQYEREFARLRELNACKGTWQRYLNRDLGRAQQIVAAAISDQVSALTGAKTAELAGRRMGISKDGLHRFMLDLHARSTQIIEDVATVIHETMAGVVRDTFLAHGLTDVSAEILADSDRLRRPGADDLPEAIGGGGILDPQLVVGGFFAGNAAYGLVARIMGGSAALGGAAAAAATGIGLPIAVVTGIGMLALNLVARDAMTRRQELQGIVRETGQQLRAELNKLFAAYLIEFRPEIEIAFDAELSRVLRELNTRLGQLQRAKQADAEERTDAIAEVEHRQGVVREQRAGIGRVIERMSADPQTIGNNRTPSGIQAVINPNKEA